jgi:MFS family permease
MTGSWRELLGAKYLGTSVVLAGGVALYATNEFLTLSLLPNTVAEIGGGRLYAWVTTLYLVGSVVAATVVNPLLVRIGPRSSYLMGLALFGVSSLACGAAPNMVVLIAARALQGVAGGLLAGLGYAVINAALPRSLWTRASALVSAMWGVATVVGPATGGVFAQFGLWRWAFVAMAILTALMAMLVPIALAAGRVDPSAATPVMKVPVWSLLLIGAAALAVSVAQIPHNAGATVALLATGVALVGLFLIVDWRMHAAVLPLSVFGRGPLKWIYLTMGVLMIGAMVDTYVPLFGQRRQIAAAPVVVASGLALGALTQRDNASVGIVALWTIALFVAGIGIGMAWPHLSVRAMDSVNDPAEGGAAAAAINTVQVISAAFGAGLAGVVVNMTEGGDVMAARWLFAVFTALSAAGVVASYGATRGHRRAPR